MNATAEIDKAGRIVVPKKMRDALHLAPGTRVSLVCLDDTIKMEMESKPVGLYYDRGWPVYDSGPVPPSDVVEWIRQDREDRMTVLRRTEHDD